MGITWEINHLGGATIEKNEAVHTSGESPHGLSPFFCAYFSTVWQVLRPYGRMLMSCQQQRTHPEERFGYPTRSMQYPWTKPQTKDAPYPPSSANSSPTTSRAMRGERRLSRAGAQRNCCSARRPQRTVHSGQGRQGGHPSTPLVHGRSRRVPIRIHRKRIHADRLATASRNE